MKGKVFDKKKESERERKEEVRENVIHFLMNEPFHSCSNEERISERLTFFWIETSCEDEEEKKHDEQMMKWWKSCFSPSSFHLPSFHPFSSLNFHSSSVFLLCERRRKRNKRKRKRNFSFVFFFLFFRSLFSLLVDCFNLIQLILWKKNLVFFSKKTFCYLLIGENSCN